MIYVFTTLLFCLGTAGFAQEKETFNARAVI